MKTKKISERQNNDGENNSLAEKNKEDYRRKAKDYMKQWKSRQSSKLHDEKSSLQAEIVTLKLQLRDNETKMVAQQSVMQKEKERHSKVELTLNAKIETFEKEGKKRVE